MSKEDEESVDSEAPDQIGDTDEDKPTSADEEIAHSDLFNELASIVGEERASETDLDRLVYSHDLAPLPKEMSLIFKTFPDVIVKPRNATDVSNIMKLATKRKIPVTPRGGGSWALGGAVPAYGGILLDMGSLQEILEIDPENLTVTVEPGVNWKFLIDTLEWKKFSIGCYPSSAPGASIGGWVNTGGVGIGSYMYGGIDNQIKWMEVVLPDGNIIQTGHRTVTNNSMEFNLKDLFVGSEGTLGVITKLTLKIFPAPEEVRPLSYSFSTLEASAPAIQALTRSDVVPYHIAFVDGPHFDMLRELGKHAPNVGTLINIVLTNYSAVNDLNEKTIDKIMKKHGGKKESNTIANHEWEERLFEARARRLGPGFLLGEGFCPMSNFADMAKRSKRVLKKMKMKGAVVGTIADRSTAVFMTYAIPNEHKLIKSMTSMAIVKKLTDQAFNVDGRPAGFGMLFAGNLSKIHPKGVHVMDDIKVALDPYYIMNPGKLIENATKFGIPLPPIMMNISMDAMAIMKGIMFTDRNKNDESGIHHSSKSKHPKKKKKR